MRRKEWATSCAAENVDKGTFVCLGENILFVPWETLAWFGYTEAPAYTQGGARDEYGGWLR